MKYEIKEINDDGSGYAVFTFDDGSSAGQFLVAMPVDDEIALRARIEAMAAEVEKRAKPKSDTGLNPIVRGLVGREVVIPKEVL